jgi:hypothetical protein
MELSKSVEGKFGHHIEYKYLIIESHSIDFTNPWKRYGTSNEKIDKILNIIYANENIQPRCFNCGKPAQHSHHIIPNGNPIHPTGLRILEQVTIPLCQSCHCSNGGFFHRIYAEYDNKLSCKFRDLVNKKNDEVHNLLWEIDNLSLSYETELATMLLNDLMDKNKPPLQTLPVLVNEEGA